MWVARVSTGLSLEDVSGQEVDDRQVAADAKVQGPGAQSLQALRSPSSIYPEVRDVSYLLPQVGIGGRSPWCREIKLVEIPIAKVKTG